MVTESYWPNADGGAEYERRLALGLSQRGHDVVVWAPGRSLRSSRQQDGDTLVEREKAATLWFNRKYKVSYWPWFRARTMISRHSPDVIHVHNFYFMGIAALFWARRAGIPVVATNHFMPENLTLNVQTLKGLGGMADKLVWKFLAYFHNRCNFVTSPTETAVNLFLNNGLLAPAQAVTNGVEIERFTARIAPDALDEAAQRYKIPRDRPIALYFGRLDGEKRVDQLIEALAQIPESDSPQLVLAGSGNAKVALQRQAERLDVSARVSFTGYVDEADKPALYQLAQLFVMSSPAELQSIVMLEAMASSLPVVSVDIAALSELCQDGRNGHLYAEGDIASLAQRIQQLARDHRQAKSFGRVSRQIVMAEHTNQVMLDSYEAILSRAAGETGV